MMRNTRYKIQDTKYKGGFTLVEVLISVGIFLMTVMAISQIFITVLRSEKVAYALLNSENNIRNNLEFMARAIRMGDKFQDNEGDFSKICFTNSQVPPKNQCFIYEDGTLKQQLGNDIQILIDPTIKITSAKFYPIRGDNSQITIIIQLEAEIKVRNQFYSFHVETAVTPRILQI